MPEENKENKPAETPAETVEEKEKREKEEKEKKETKKEDKVTLESIQEQLKSMGKRLSDKDSHIGTIENENKELRDKIQNISSSLGGKTEKQKDSILGSAKKKFLDKGYDEETVDLILETVSTVADQRVEKGTAKIISDSAYELIEADKTIDQKFVLANEAVIMAEFNSYKLDEKSARKMKQNFKKAYDVVKNNLAKKATATNREKSGEEREEMLEGNKPPGTNKKTSQGDEDFVNSIEKSGNANSHFI